MIHKGLYRTNGDQILFHQQIQAADCLETRKKHQLKENNE